MCRLEDCYSLCVDRRIVTVCVWTGGLLQFVCGQEDCYSLCVDWRIVTVCVWTGSLYDFFVDRIMVWFVCGQDNW